MTGDKTYLKVRAQLDTVVALKDHIVVSGGMAIHLLSPPHRESKYLHDHSDVDLFVINNGFYEKAEAAGLRRIWSKYDGQGNFYRYHKTEEVEGVRVKVLIDAFIDFNVPFFEHDSIKVLDPDYLIGLYQKKALHPEGEEYRQRQVDFLRNWLSHNPGTI